MEDFVPRKKTYVADIERYDRSLGSGCAEKLHAFYLAHLSHCILGKIFLVCCYSVQTNGRDVV